MRVQHLCNLENMKRYYIRIKATLKAKIVPLTPENKNENSYVCVRTRDQRTEDSLPKTRVYDRAGEIEIECHKLLVIASVASCQIVQCLPRGLPRGSESGSWVLGIPEKTEYQRKSKVRPKQLL